MRALFKGAGVKYLTAALLVSVVLGYSFYIHQKPERFDRVVSKRYLTIGCSIVSPKKELVWSLFSKVLCWYFDDGRFLASAGKELSFISKAGELIWKLDLEVHHQIKVYGETIYVLGRGAAVKEGRRVGFDVIHTLDFNGNILKTFSFAPHSKFSDPKYSFKKLMMGGYLRKLFSREKDHFHNLKIDYEGTHVNSFYKVPKGFVGEYKEFYKRVEFVANDTFGKKIFLIDDQLEKLEKTIEYQDISENLRLANIHDVQVLSSGKILIYLNDTPLDKVTKIMLYDPVLKDVEVLFEAMLLMFHLTNFCLLTLQRRPRWRSWRSRRPWRWPRRRSRRNERRQQSLGRSASSQGYLCRPRKGGCLGYP